MESRGKEWLGRIWIFLVGLGLTGSGIFFCWWLWAAWDKARAMDDWIEVEAVVLSSEVVTYRYNEFSQPEFMPLVRYRYGLSGRNFEADAIRLVPLRKGRLEEAAKWTERFPAGKSVRAYVDPEQPGRAVLRKNSKAALYAIWFPGLFAALGMGMCGNVLRTCLCRKSGVKRPALGGPGQPSA